MTRFPQVQRVDQVFLVPQEETHPLADLVRDGVTGFTAAPEDPASLAEALARAAAVHVPHPLPPAPPERVPHTRPHPLTVGCFGRLRDYKRTLPFVRAFLAGAHPSARLLVAGAPDSEEAHTALTELAAADGRLDYRPGFVDDHAAFWRLLAEVEWVALPYERLHSSGVLVAALQARRRILSPTPIGGTDLYVPGARRWWWTCIDPWDDHQAVAAWRSAATLSSTMPPSSTLSLPTWVQTADHLAAFYARLTCPAAGTAPARVGIL
ncbi:MAG: hypothetical protein JO362_15075 [Streptomycetaceae bacterium]|nr:hypothetical protein [Streptomycetaceae bacterium]